MYFNVKCKDMQTYSVFCSYEEGQFVDPQLTNVQTWNSGINIPQGIFNVEPFENDT